MFKKLFLCIAICCFSGAFAQKSGDFQIRKVAVHDTIKLDSTSINPSFFEILDADGNLIAQKFYKVDFEKSHVIFMPNYAFAEDSLTVKYRKLPDYLTRKYSIYDEDRVVSNDAFSGRLYQINDKQRSKFVPFDGLNTSGSLTRGITVGNNQNAVVNSALDLQITGKISDKVSLRASLQDTNIPLQEGGYSQKLDEFDQIFIELFSDKWSIRAGDLFLENRKSRFLNFNKKVQGISGQFEFGSPEQKTTIFAAGAIVKGQYAKSAFIGQEGNQGPYKLTGPNGELYILVISGSERVFVNGILLKRGESNDYVIDYNAGEIRFTSLFPITSEMRINVEYQYSDRSYTRFVTYAGATHEREKWSVGGYLYSETDVKNQPLQQNLSAEQVQILADAGDDKLLMNAPSAYLDTYSENKILYRKIIVAGETVYEFSTDETAALYNVRFTMVGSNNGNYTLVNSAAVGRIYEYVAPVGGVLQGNYEPIVRLSAPEKIQIATVMAKYNPTDKTSVDFEGGISNNDLNLFSNISDNDNTGFAGRLNMKQRLFERKTKLDAFANIQYVQKEFRTIERLFAIEFNRDWNLVNPAGNQSLVITGLNYSIPNKGFAQYQFEKLDFSENFSGSRHVLESNLKFKNVSLQTSGSYLQSDGETARSKFLRNYTQLRLHRNQNWIGSSFRHEDNQERLVATNELSGISQRFTEAGAFIGRGDSTKVYVELGYLNRVNDSLKSGVLQRVSKSDSYYLKSKLIQNEKTNLSLFVNYRKLRFEDARVSEPSLNSRLVYNDRYFDQLIQVTTTYENTSGTLPQQEFTYLEVDAGQGVYTWNDYNDNGVQELEEFEVARFADQAKYVRVFLPNQIFIKTHQNKFSQSLTLNPAQWQNEKGYKKVLSYFYNQTSFITDRKILRRGDNFDFNPFSTSNDDVLGLNSAIRNSLYYNRGKQKNSITYNFLGARAKNLLSVGSQQSENSSHQLQYANLFKKSWLLALAAKTSQSNAYSENYASKNFELTGFELAPKLSYLFNKNASWDLFYEYAVVENLINERETLDRHRLGTSFAYASEKKITINGEFSFYQNNYSGDPLSPVAYQMLEGLQPGKNMTWRLLLQKNLTQFLDINVNYQGRKSETSKAIHTGNVQLRAFF